MEQVVHSSVINVHVLVQVSQEHHASAELISSVVHRKGGKHSKRLNKLHCLLLSSTELTVGASVAAVYMMYTLEQLLAVATAAV
jgi:hypothetical protein